MKLRRKLLSAGFALGASALTLTTSTFAWYTQNSVATVGEISGATEAGTDTNLFVSNATGYNASYAPTAFSGFVPSVQPVLTGGATTDHKLKPVSYANSTTTAGAYVKIDNENTAGTAAAYLAHDENDIYSYTLRFNGNGSNLYFKEFDLDITNNDGYTGMIAINHGDVNDGTNTHKTGITSAGNYYASLARSLKLTITYQHLQESSAAGAVSGYAKTGDASTTTYSLDAFKQADDVNINSSTGANAVGYYNSVFGTNLPTTAGAVNKTVAGTGITTAAGTPLVFATLGTYGCVEVQFTFWLDGWDEYCYDVMMNQNFEFKFVATTTESNSIINRTA